MNEKLNIKICPTCGSDQIRRIISDVTRIYKGQAYTIPSLDYFDCPNCGEKVYDREAIRKIEAYSPAYHCVTVEA
jgi:YgiT-type zinc finger domain-containing protein